MADVFISYSRRDADVRPRVARVPDLCRARRLGRLGGHPARLAVGARHRRVDRRRRQLRLRRQPRARSPRGTARWSSAGAKERQAHRAGRMRARRPDNRTARPARAELDLVPRRGRPRSGAREARRAPSTPTSSGPGRTRGCSSARSSGTSGATRACSCAAATSNRPRRRWQRTRARSRRRRSSCSGTCSRAARRRRGASGSRSAGSRSRSSSRSRSPRLAFLQRNQRD